MEYEELKDAMRQPKKKESTVRNVRGYARINMETLDVDFRASQPSEPVQHNVKKYGGGSFYETEGRKESSYIAHLKVSKASSDPAAELADQLEKVLPAELRNRSEGLLTPPRKCLENTDVLKIWHNRKTRKIVVQMEIATDTGRDPSDALFQLSAATNKCFAINRTSLQQRGK